MLRRGYLRTDDYREYSSTRKLKREIDHTRCFGSLALRNDPNMRLASGLICSLATVPTTGIEIPERIVQGKCAPAVDESAGTFAVSQPSVPHPPMLRQLSSWLICRLCDPRGSWLRLLRSRRRHGLLGRCTKRSDDCSEEDGEHGAHDKILLEGHYDTTPRRIGRCKLQAG
jgi:hypothetical protein